MAGSFSLEDLTEEQRKKLLEDFAPGAIGTGPMARGAQGFAPLPLPKGLGGAFESTPTRGGVDPDIFARFAAAQQRGSKLDALNALGHGFGADAALIAGTGVNTIAREPGRRGQPVAELGARIGAERSIAQQERQKEIDTAELAKTRADTRKSEVSAQSSEEEAKREAALADPSSPESASMRSTAMQLLKGRITPETLGTMSGVQIRDALKFGTSQINAEVMADYRTQALKQQDENAEAQRKLQAWALAQGWNIAKLTLEQRERLAEMEAEIKKQQKAKEDTDKTSEREGKLRGEILNLPTVKEYQMAGIGLDKVRNAAKDPTPAGDIALIFGYMKTIDPTSVVRETEFATAQNAAGVPDRVRNLYNNLKSGERLNPEQRKEFISSAESQFQAYENRAKGLVSGYRDLASREGLNFNNIVLPGLIIDSSAPVGTPGIKSSTNPSKKPPPARGSKPPPGGPSRPDRKLDPTKKVVNTTTSSDGTLFREDYEDGTYGLKRIKKSE